MARSLFWSLLVLFIVANSLPAAAGSRVKLVREGSTIELSHGMATRFRSADGRSEVHLLFAARKPDGVVMVDPFGVVGFAAQKWSSAEGVPVVKISFEEDDPENFSLNVYPGDDTMMALGGHVSGDGRQGPFSRLKLEPQQIGGELQMDHDRATLTGTFDLSSVTVEEAPATRGASVGQSPQAMVLLGFARAMNRLNFAEAQKFSLRDVEKELTSAKEALGEAAVKEFIRESFGNPKELEKRLASAEAELASAGDRSRIRLVKRTKEQAGEHTSTQTFSFRRIDGQWMMD